MLFSAIVDSLLNPVQIDRTDVDLVPGLLHLSPALLLRADGELILQPCRFTPVPQGVTKLRAAPLTCSG